MSAPWPSADRTRGGVGDLVRDVLGGSVRSAGEKSQANDPTRPIRSSARRSSGWKTTTSANRPTTAPVWRIWVRSRRLERRAAA